jgi:hypothetical protein
MFLFAATLGLVALTTGLRADEILIQTGCTSGCVQTTVVQPCPAPVCEEQVHKVCVPTTKTKTVEMTCYRSRCEDFCLPRCSCRLTPCHRTPHCWDGNCDGGKCGCNDCGNNCGGDCEGCRNCGKVRTRKFLVIKVRKHEECIPACEVVHECAPTCGGCPTVYGCGTSTVIVEPVRPTERLPNPPRVVDPMKR